MNPETNPTSGLTSAVSELQLLTSGQKAAVHDEAPRAKDTDGPQILALYQLLKRMSDNPMVLRTDAFTIR